MAVAPSDSQGQVGEENRPGGTARRLACTRVLAASASLAATHRLLASMPRQLRQQPLSLPSPHPPLKLNQCWTLACDALWVLLCTWAAAGRPHRRASGPV